MGIGHSYTFKFQQLIKYSIGRPGLPKRRVGYEKLPVGISLKNTGCQSFKAPISNNWSPEDLAEQESELRCVVGFVF